MAARVSLSPSPVSYVFAKRAIVATCANIQSRPLRLSILVSIVSPTHALMELFVRLEVASALLDTLDSIVKLYQA